MFNIYTQGSYSEVTLDSKTIISSYSLPIATIDQGNQSITINVEAVQEFYSNTTSKHVNRAFITILNTLEEFIQATPTEQVTKTRELIFIHEMLTTAYKSNGRKRLEALSLANDRLSDHYYQVYNMNQLVYNYMNEGAF